MKTETLLSIIQTAALCVIALLLLVLTISGRSASTSDVQELAALYQIKGELFRESSRDVASVKDLEESTEEKTAQIGRLIELRKEDSKKSSGKVSALSKLIEAKSRSVLPE